MSTDRTTRPDLREQPYTISALDHYLLKRNRLIVVEDQRLRRRICGQRDRGGLVNLVTECADVTVHDLCGQPGTIHAALGILDLPGAIEVIPRSVQDAIRGEGQGDVHVIEVAAEVEPCRPTPARAIGIPDAFVCSTVGNVRDAGCVKRQGDL